MIDAAPEGPHERLVGTLGVPMTYGEGDAYCDPQCPFLVTDKNHNGTCARDGKELGFYDWFLAHCKGQTDAPNAVVSGGGTPSA